MSPVVYRTSVLMLMLLVNGAYVHVSRDITMETASVVGTLYCPLCRVGGVGLGFDTVV